jgi:hypothetical protein
MSDLSEMDTYSASNSENGSVCAGSASAAPVHGGLKRQNARSESRDVDATHAIPDDLVYELFDAIDSVNEKVTELRAAMSAQQVKPV